jgi:hypothetical protein
MQAQLRGDPGDWPALAGQADALQPPSQPRGKRVLSEPSLQVSPLPVGEDNV